MAPKSTSKEYIETETGNKISRKSTILGTQQITLGGKSVISHDCTIRGDLYRTLLPHSASGTKDSAAERSSAKGGPSITIGRHSYIAPSALLRPPHKASHGAYTFYPLRLGEHVLVGQGAVVQAASVGSFVQIGKGVVIGKFVLIRDHVKILEGSVVPDWAVLPPNSVWAGKPARWVRDLTDGESEGMDLRELYKAAGK